MNLHALLGQKPGSNDITAVLTEVTKGANITGIVPEPDVKIYKDAVYYSYLPLGISFNFEPSIPLSTARNAPKPDPALLSLVAIHLYSHPTDKFATFPLSFTVSVRPSQASTPVTVVELDMTRKAHEVVSFLGEPEKKEVLSLFGMYFFFLSTAQPSNKVPHMDNVNANELQQDATDPALSPLEARVQGLIDNNKVMVFSKSYCPYSAAAKKLLKSYTPDLHILEVDHESEGAAIKDVLIKITHGHKTFPSIFLQGVSIGGWDNLEAMDKNNELKPRLEAMGVELL
ncbi:hypothetical protein BGZ74_005809 [Mortierella antarctica]|nr:hypothetical protein BGZ74_005809 [Mortierella antarctica]